MLVQKCLKLDFYWSIKVHCKDFSFFLSLLWARIELGLLLHHPPPSVCWVGTRWLRICQQRESESEPEKSKTQLTEFFWARKGRKRKAGKSTSRCGEKKTAKKSATFILKANIKHHQTHRMRHFDLPSSTGSQHL